MSSLSGHLWTLAARLRDLARPPQEPPSAPWSCRVPDRRWHRVMLRGNLSEPPGAETLLLVVHGLGGSSSSGYAIRAAIAAHRRGWACLRLSLRGAEGDGEDLYHAGLAGDLQAALASGQVQRYRRRLVLGFSLGGHLALRHGVDGAGDCEAVAAVCPPLDLALTVARIDRAGLFLYRAYVLRSLKDSYRKLVARGRAPAAWERVRRVRSLREWDEITVAPRFGFRGAGDYYQSASVAPLLAELSVPAMVVEAASDPMIPPSNSISEALPDSPLLEMRGTARGGHVGFPETLDLGEAGARGLEEQVLTWLGRSSEAGRAPGTTAGCDSLKAAES